MDTKLNNILSIYDQILENKKMISLDETSVVLKNTNYSNVKFDTDGTQNDMVNQALLDDIQKAASSAGVTVTITTAISGHGAETASGNKSRHPSGNAVDISVVNGSSVSPSNRNDTDKFVNSLISLGYTKNSESGNPKAVLTFGFPGHDNHVHVSNTTNSTSDITQGFIPDLTTTNTPNTQTNTSNPIHNPNVDSAILNAAGGIAKSLGLKEEKIYSDFGKNTKTNYGTILIPKDDNKKIKSPVSGVVSNRRYNSSCSNQITIEHQINGKKFFLEYCGISDPSVRSGSSVSPGTTLGTSDSDVNVTLYNSSYDKENIGSYLNKDISTPKKFKNPEYSSRSNIHGPESEIQRFLTKSIKTIVKPFKNQYDDNGNMIEKRWASPTEKEQPVDWINKLSPTYKKKVTENINRIKGLL